MKKFILLFFAVPSIVYSFPSDLVRKETCRFSETDTYSSSDFPWNQPLAEAQERGKNLYHSSKRLYKRAYLNEKNEVVIPVNAGGAYKDVKVSETFIKSVRLHIEEGLKRRYVDIINFSDMGHSHFFVPEKFYDSELSDIPVDNFHLLYEKMLGHKELKILYHTAEQLMMKDSEGNLLSDRHIQWRFFTRNLLGDNKAQGKIELLHQEDHRYNTARDYDPGYKYWGGGFYLAASSKGCFPFEHKGKTYYFDVNLDGIEGR
ncbi:MAG: hypothetical protein ACLGHN_00735 [Bacteriovoracia bacterium]